VERVRWCSVQGVCCSAACRWGTLKGGLGCTPDGQMDDARLNVALALTGWH